jgi:acyl-homoserine lactone acylase PvdQ
MNLAELMGASQQFLKRWWTRRTRILLVCLAVLTPVIGVGGVLARGAVRRGWPDVEGALSLAGLDAPVTIVRDAQGVPHIYAETEHDLYLAQGYVHAQDRFWGMELNRRRGRGVLTELLGDSALMSDERWAALNLADVAARELVRMDADDRARLVAYAAGVNAWLEADRLPFEFTLLRWRGRGVEHPVPWTAEDSLIVALVLSWQLGGPRVEPTLAARIVDRVGPERAAFLLEEEGRPSAEMPLQPSQTATALLPCRWALSGRVTWIGGDQTASGKALYAVDLPTDLSLPAPWYVMASHVGDVGAAGASVPGLPGLVIGTGDADLWKSWAEAEGVALGEGMPPWRGWLLSALFDQVLQLDDPQAVGTLADLRGWLLDTFSARAARLIPFLVEVEPQGWRQERVTGMLRKWDFRIGDNNKEAPFFAVYQLELARAAFVDELSADLFEAYAAHTDLYQAALDRIIQDPDDAWWDDVNTPERELRGDILKQAYEPALEWIGRNYGDLHMLWEWDIVHGSRLEHPLADVWPWDQLLSRDLALDGWADTVNTSPGGLPCRCASIQSVTEDNGLCVQAGLFRAQAAYGYRQIVDASDPSTLRFALLPGQSGHPFHSHYDDLLDEWLSGEYLSLRLAPSPEDVVGSASRLILTPEE